MSTKIKLVYYDLRGRAEITRYVLIAGNIPFEEERIELSKFPILKGNYNLPAGQIPIVILPDGKILNESLAIARYFADQTNLGGSTLMEKYLCDRAIFTLEDLFKAFGMLYEEKEEKKKNSLQQNLRNSVLPKFLRILTNYLKETSGPFFLGNKPSYADMHLVHILDNAAESEYEAYPEILHCRKTILERYPALGKYRDLHPNLGI